MWQEFDQLSQRLRIPDLWQQTALEHLRHGRDVVIDAPTGAGKTFVFELLVEDGRLDGQAVYTVPTRALANDKRLEWKQRGWQVGIATGDLTDQPNAPVLVATLETQLERILRRDPPRLLVIDEYQLIGHRVRGPHYEQTIALAPPQTQLLLLSGSNGNPGDVVEWLQRLGRDAVLVQTAERPVPLEETPVEALAERPPRGIDGYWPRLAATALLADLAPLLIFAPRRREAERIARQIANALPPSAPLSLTREQQAVAGREVGRLLQQRVAWHHSGLSYRVRAGLIEPLAKAGHLRVIVATTGLAAGINFSVRSVLVASTTYPDGPYLRQLEGDELLQMFGRAGRRGLDTVGHVLVTRDSPRLSDGRQRPVRRPAEAGWPVLLRLMHEAASRGEPPLAAAYGLTSRLFSRQPPPLGLEPPDPVATGAVAGSALPESRGGSGPRGDLGSRHDPLACLSAGPQQVEFLNSRDEWEPLQDHQRQPTTVGNALARRRDRWLPALSDPDHAAALEPSGRTWLMPSNDYDPAAAHQPTGAALPPRGRSRRRYGRELTAALRRDGRLQPTRPFVRLLAIDRRPAPDEPDTVERWLERLRAREPDRRHECQLVWLGDSLMLRRDLSQRTVDAVRDRHGRCLIDPPLRVGAVEAETGLCETLGGGLRQPRPDSPLDAWRKLGLIDEQAVPTRRGSVFCLFQHGEGLAVAAALEENHYPADQLVMHLANLRGPLVREEPAGGDSERLAAACHRAYGTRSYPGYLLHGLPEHYSEGLAERLQDHLDGRRPRAGALEDLAKGDLDRALVEWLSLLRRIDSAPALDWDRWTDLQQAAREALGRHRRGSALDQLPPLTGSQLQPPPPHALRLGRF